MDKNMTSSHSPLVTVMMPVHNGDKYIKFAIESILSQSYKDFELLIVNDASNDQTVEIVSSFQDPRIRLIHNSKQRGLSLTRQRGVSEAKGSLIAFLDSDDIALSSRLEKQVYFLKNNRQIAAVGSFVEVIDEKGKKTGKVWRHITPYKVIPSILLFRNCFTQSSMMMRKNYLLEFGYREDYWAAPDYDLWSRMIGKYKMANMGEVLTFYRAYKESMSHMEKDKIKSCTQKIMADSLGRLGLNPTPEEVEIHDSLERHRTEFSSDVIGKVESWLIKLILANRKRRFYNQDLFNSVVSDYWFKVCCVSANQGLAIFKKYYFSNLVREENSNWRKNLILFTLSVLHKSRQIDVTSDMWMKIIH